MNSTNTPTVSETTSVSLSGDIISTQVDPSHSQVDISIIPREAQEGFYDPKPDRPMKSGEFLQYLNIDQLVVSLKKYYKNIHHYHYPIEAMVKLMIYQRMAGIRCVTELSSKLQTDRQLALMLGFKPDRYDIVRVPARRTISHFMYERLGIGGLLEVEEYLLREIRDQCKELGIPFGERLAVDSTPLEASEHDPDSEWNAHYEEDMYKLVFLSVSMFQGVRRMMVSF